ncbi:hypothetical protein CBFG_00681 [Clostridiales bacterium 1_7_47FAA]|nr:hypothetical protein CBFG_00681 [Clostridiales bacterium 1_7_47FAA]
MPPFPGRFHENADFLYCRGVVPSFLLNRRQHSLEFRDTSLAILSMVRGSLQCPLMKAGMVWTESLPWMCA